MGESPSPIFDSEKLKTLQKEIGTFLGEQVEKRSGRRNVVLNVEAAEKENEVSLSISKSHMRDTLFSLLIQKTDKGYRVEGRIISENDQPMIQYIVNKFLGEANTTWNLEVGVLGFGIVSVPCADLYVEPNKNKGENLTSQILYGTPVILLETTSDKKFFRVQNQLDGYLAWMATENFCIVTRERWQNWLHSPKVYLHSFLDKPTILFPGTSVGFSEGKLFLFDPEQGSRSLEIDAKSYVAPLHKASPEEIIKTAKRFLPTADLGGITYLWGGTCVPQLDCSGFVQTVFRLNNILLPRDSDQQCQFTQPVSRQEMQPSDLIFFSKHGRHPTHVGIYLGNDQYIHCSPAGEESGVKISSLSGTTPYEKALVQMYYASGRILKK